MLMAGQAAPNFNDLLATLDIRRGRNALIGLDERKRLEAELTDMRRKMATGGSGGAAPAGHKDVGGIAYAGRVLDGVPARELKSFSPEVRREYIQRQDTEQRIPGEQSGGGKVDPRKKIPLEPGPTGQLDPREESRRLYEQAYGRPV